MKTKLALSAVAAAVAVFSQGAFAQASAPVNRADVKAEGRAATKAPTGEAQTMTPQPSKASDKTRDERKATTKQDKAAGNLKPAGEQTAVKDSKVPTGTETTRADRKATAKADNKSGKIKSGEKP